MAGEDAGEGAYIEVKLMVVYTPAAAAAAAAYYTGNTIQDKIVEIVDGDRLPALAGERDRHGEVVGRRLDVAPKSLEALLAGKTVFSRPTRDIAGRNGGTLASTVFHAAAPVIDSADVTRKDGATSMRFLRSA